MSSPKSSAGARAAAPPPGAWRPLVKVSAHLSRRLNSVLAFEPASGLLLMAAAVAALVWANSSASRSYAALWHVPVGLRLGSFVFERSLEWFVNDVLMVIFFFVVGIEIRKELHDGQLSEWRRAALPVVGALGGMVAPALFYLALARAPEAHHGWGIPMATDIAFALGVLTLLGKRTPAPLRVLLLALAVIDDLGAILVIAIFYSSGIAVSGLLWAAFGLLSIVALRATGVRNSSLYVVPGIVVWAGVYSAGIHPTIAGVLVGLLTPVAAWSGVEQESPADHLEHALKPWVSYAIMPIFALANAGVNVSGFSLSGSGAEVSLAIVVALLLGKPVGIVLSCALSLWGKLAVLPEGLSARHLLVLGIAAGIGFTMSLFIAQLAFEDQALLDAAKLGVLVASVLAMVAGLLAGLVLLPTPRDTEAPR